MSDNQPDGTMCATLKYKGKTYALGFSLDESMTVNEKLLRALSRSMETTVRCALRGVTIDRSTKQLQLPERAKEPQLHNV